MSEYAVVYITAPDEESAQNIANLLVKERLAGCVNIIKNIRSIYFWQGSIEDEPEVLMIVKTKRELFKKLSDKVKSVHPYSVPEIIAMPIIEGSEDYLRWLDETTEKGCK
ncbi:MAG: divalent-cation tolerance protein CutA [Thermodesulfovibrionales bacterium]